MSLAPVPDFDRIIKRFDAWFNCDLYDRPPVTFIPAWVRNADGALPEKKYKSPEEATLDADFRVEWFEKSLPFQDFYGDTVPTFIPSIGSQIGLMSLLFGGKVMMNGVSSWAEPSLGSAREVLNRVPDFNIPAWEALRKMTDISLERSQGRWLTGIFGSGDATSLLVDLIGPEKLCLETMDDPEGVKLACSHIDSHLPAIYTDIWKRIDAAGYPTAPNAEGVIAYGLLTRLDADFLYMISREMGEEIFYPSLRRRTRDFERCWWHADGKGWLNHLDFILDDDRVSGVQWVYGAGNGPAAKWIDVYQRIQRAGKSIEMLAESGEDALAVMKNLHPEGVWIKFWHAPSPEEANWFMAEVAKPSNWRQGR